MNALDCFQMPKPVKISGRSSSVTNSFVNGVIPIVYPRQEEVAEALNILSLTHEDLRCVYCGDSATEWDHFRPIVKKQRPTGYISEIANLVPACGKCNQSKGASDWRKWMTGSAKRSPATRRITDLNNRILRLSNFEQWREPTRIDFEAVLGPDLWTRYWSTHQHLLTAMRESESIAGEVREAIQQSLSA
jgi:hypothetical protein